MKVTSLHGDVSYDGKRTLAGMTSVKQKFAELTQPAFSLPILSQARDGTNETGVSIDAYGLGQLSAVFFTAPAHSETEVNFTVNMFCLTPADVANLSNLIRSLLDASHQRIYDDMQSTGVTGGAGFFGFFSWGARANYSSTKRRMDSWGLSEENQKTIVQAMMERTAVINTFTYRSVVHNTNNDYDVTGNIYGVVMDVTASFNGFQKQYRVLAPKPVLHDPGSGDTLPVVDPLYPPPNG